MIQPVADTIGVEYRLFGFGVVGTEQFETARLRSATLWRDNQPESRIVFPPHALEADHQHNNDIIGETAWKVNGDKKKVPGRGYLFYNRLAYPSASSNLSESNVETPRSAIVTP